MAGWLKLEIYHSIGSSCPQTMEESSNIGKLFADLFLIGTIIGCFVAYLMCLGAC
jgi:hypothetical protein